MSLLFRPDWEKTKERWKCWWAGEDFGRCAITIFAPNEARKGAKPPKFPEDAVERRLGLDFLPEALDYWMGNTYYGGDAVPIWSPGCTGWDSVPAYLGSEVVIAEGTDWIFPFINDGELTDYDYKDINIKPDNKWWVYAHKRMNFAADYAKGKFIVGSLDIGGAGDVLAGIRSTEKLLYDLVDCPDYVREFELHLADIWVDVYNTFYDITGEVSEGSGGWLNIWAPGRFYVPQNDFSYMISPEMYESIFLPALEKQLGCLDYSIYHLDGAAAFRHLDLLLSISRLDGIQVFPGTGKATPRYYMNVLKKIQAAGKKIQIELPPEDIEAVLDELSAKNLLIQTRCETEQDAKDLLHCVEKWSKWRG